MRETVPRHNQDSGGSFTMKRSTDRILTTHTGSLPRPPDLLPLLFAKEEGEAVDPEALEHAIRSGVTDVVRKQAEAGVDVVNDGEMGKISYASYVHDRLTGFEGHGTMPSLGDLVDYPEFAPRVFQGSEEALKHLRMLACSGPISVKDRDQVKRDIANLKAATQGTPVEDVFM